jgi:hypothetical protein
MIGWLEVEIGLWVRLLQGFIGDFGTTGEDSLEV